MRCRSVWYVVALLLIGLLLFGCGKDETPTASEPASASTTTPAVETPADAVVEAPAEATVETPVEPAEAVETPAESVEDLGEVVATINGIPAYQSQLDDAKSSLLSQYNQIYAQFGMSISSLLVGAEGRMFELSLEAEALSNVMSTVLIQAEADARGLTPSEEEVNAEFQVQYDQILATQGWTETELADYLAANLGMTLDTFKSNGKETIAWQLTLEAVTAEIGGEVETTEEELAAYFEENRDTYSTEEQVRAAHILVSTQEEAEEILAELEGGADFGELAKERSIDTGSGADGGELGWFGRGQMVSEFEDAAFALEVGQTSGIVESQYGFHIILLEEHQDAYEPELADVIDEVRSAVEDEVRNERLQTWFSELYESADKQIFLPLISAITLQYDDIDQSIAELERVRSEGLSDEVYLPYLIGAMIEVKISELQESLDTLQSEEEQTDETRAQIASLEAEIEQWTARAITEYEAALEAVGEDTDIQAKIDSLSPQPTDAEASADDAASNETP